MLYKFDVIIVLTFIIAWQHQGDGLRIQFKTSVTIPANTIKNPSSRSVPAGVNCLYTCHIRLLMDAF